MEVIYDVTLGKRYRPGYLYLFHSPRLDAHKIGHTELLRTRYSQIKIITKDDTLSLVVAYKGTWRLLEELLHIHYCDKRIEYHTTCDRTGLCTRHREFFRLSASDIVDIDQYVRKVDSTNKFF